MILVRSFVCHRRRHGVEVSQNVEKNESHLDDVIIVWPYLPRI